MIELLHIGVLMGGFGSEKEVSLKTGEACSDALKNCQNYRISDLVVDKNFITNIQRIKPDICFNALHGQFGEDGTIQGFLNTMQIPYTHSGVSASSIAMNKNYTKYIISKLTENSEDPIIFPKTLILEELNNYNLEKPLVIKPVKGGSSVGVQILNKSNDKIYLKKINNANLMIEPLVGNRELTVTVLNDKPLTVTEISPKENAFYDYKSKYKSKGSVHQLPAKIPKNIFDKAMNWAQRSHKILGCKGVSRSDFRFDDKDKKLYMLEINTQPGMTKTSLVPEQAKFCNISMTKLVEILINQAQWENQC